MKLFLTCIFLICICIILPHQVFAVSFTDHTGYLPQWAQNEEQAQVMITCSNESTGTPDFNWCLEFSGYVLDQLNSDTSVNFADHVGYTPAWAHTMGKVQALGVCNLVTYGTQDSNWCFEFSKYVLAQQNNSANNTSNTSSKGSQSQSEQQPQSSQLKNLDIVDYFPPSDSNIFNNNSWDVSISDGTDPFYSMGATQAQTRFYKSDYLDGEPTTMVEIGQFSDGKSAKSAMNNIMTFRTHQGFQTSEYNSNTNVNCYEAKVPSDIAYIDDIVCDIGNLVVHISVNGNQYQTPPMARAFMDAVLANISSQNTSVQQPASTNENSVFAPCPAVQVTVPSDCLGRYLPTSSEIGSQWTSQDGQSIPLGANPNAMITQYVHQDYENYHTTPQEVFDVWIEEWKSENTANNAFKTEEKSASSAKYFAGNPDSNDTFFVYVVDQGYNQLSNNEEFRLGAVIVKIDGTGGSKDSINDMRTITKIILDKLAQSVQQNNPSTSLQNPSISAATSSAQVNLQTPIPSWIKNNAKWWSEGNLSDTEFVSGIQYLIQQKIITISSTSQGTSSQNSGQIPQWIKSNAGFWANGQIDDSEFVRGMQYLVQVGIIQMSTVQQTSKQTSNPTPNSPTTSQHVTGILKMDKSQYSANANPSEYATVSGKVNDPNGGYVVLTITYPYGGTDQLNAYVTSTGTFSSLMILDKSYPAGTYTISGNYHNSDIGTVSFIVK